MSTPCKRELETWLIGFKGRPNSFPQEVGILIYYQYAHVSSVFNRPGYFVLLSSFHSNPAVSSSRLEEFLQDPAFIIRTSMKRHQWVGPYKQVFKFAILAFLQAKEFCDQHGRRIPIVEEVFGQILSGESEGLYIDKEALAMLLSHYNLSAYNYETSQ